MSRLILIVDDVEVNRQKLRHMLSEDYTLMEAENGREAVTLLMLNYQQISAVLLDLAMPVMDGFTVLKKMQQNPVLAQIPVIVSTNSTDPETEAEALALGATDFVVKPFVTEILLRRLHNIIRLRESSQLVNSYQRDKLTGLWNRETFFERAAKSILKAPEGQYVLGCMDIDNFKVINDRYGTEMGDMVLKCLARELQHASESDSSLCGRISADNFVILMDSALMAQSEARQSEYEATVLSELGVPVMLSMGQYLVEDKHLGVSAMYDRARIARNTVKGQYKARLAVYSEVMRSQIVREQSIISEMNAALRAGQFETWFQPQYNHSTGALIGAEALVRWRHPTLGLISPADFIPIFERSGFVYELDKHVWETVCAHMRRWMDEGKKPLPVSVNVSRYDLFREDLVDTVASIVERSGVTEDLLRLEITESAFSGIDGRVIGAVKQLIRLGFTVEIDDFGSGYSSLNTLKDVPAQILKLDMRFLESSENTDRGGNILESVVRMAKWLGMSVIAEGVESVAQADFLKSIGCRYVQGYLYAKPIPMADYEILAGRTAKEAQLKGLLTVENLNNNAFWDPESMDTLIFNSYAGVASIFEWRGGHMEILRANERYARMLCGESASIQDALKLSLEDYMDGDAVEAFHKAVQRAIDTKRDATCEVVLTDLPCAPGKTYLRATLRAIASAGKRYLIYASSDNITLLKESEQRANTLAEQLRAILESVGAGVRAVTLEEDGPKLLLTNSRYGQLMGQAAPETDDGAPENIHPDDLDCLREALSGLREPGDGASVAFRVLDPEGGTRQIQGDVTVTRISGLARPVRLSVYSDVTAQRAATSKIINANLQMRAVMRNADCGVAAMTIEGGSIRYLYQNERYSAMFGYTPEQFSAELQNGILDIIPPEDAARVDGVVRSNEEAEGVATVEFRVKRRSGGLCWVRCGASVCRMEGVQAPVHVVVLTDITREKDDQARIQALNESMRALIDGIPGGFAQLRLCPDGFFQPIYVNDGFLRLAGMSREAAMDGGKWTDGNFVHPEDAEAVREAVKRMIATGEAAGVKFRMLRGDGGNLYVRFSGRADRGADGEISINAYFADASAEEAGDRAARDALPAVLGAVMAASPDLLFAKDRNLRYLCCSPAFARFAAGREAADVAGRSDAELWGEEAAGRIAEQDRQLLATGEPQIDQLISLPGRDGALADFRFTKQLLYDSAGAVAGLCGCGRDATQERAAFERLKFLTDAIPGGLAAVSVCDGAGKLACVSDGLARILGYARQEFAAALDSGLEALVPMEDLPALRERLAAMRRGDASALRGDAFRVRGKDGRCRWVNLQCSPMETRGSQSKYYALITDVTENQRAFQNLRLREAEYRLATERSGGLIYRYDHATRSVDLSEDAARLFALPRHLEDVPESLIRGDALAPESEEACRAFFAAVKRGDKTGETTIRRKVASGQWRWFSGDFSNVFDGEGEPLSAIVVFSDVTQQREKEAAYRRWQLSIGEKRPTMYTLARYNISKNAAQDSASGALLGKALDGALPFSEAMWAYAQGRVHPEDRASFLSAVHTDALLAAYYRGDRTRALEYRESPSGQGARWLKLTMELIEYPNSQEVEAFMMFENIDAAKREVMLIHEKAELDPLTGVLNRATFAARMDRLLRQAPEGSLCALLMLDVDNFKLLNDGFGHAAGDQALIDIAHTLRGRLRAEDLLGRLGGDEFVIMMANMPSREAVGQRAQQICETLRKAYSREITLSVSIGVSIAPQDGGDFDALYHRADSALYAVKKGGRDGFMFFAPEMPMGEMTREPVQNSAAQEAAGDKRRMLIVEDNELDLEVLSSLFDNEFIVDKAKDGRSALSRMRYYGTAISVVLLDLGLPDMDGMEVLEKMRASAQMQLIPVIVVSASSVQEASLQTIRSGASDFVTKPVDSEILRIRVYSAISKAENERLLAQNSFLSLQNSEVSMYRAALKSTDTAVVALDWKSGEFHYDVGITRYLAGIFDKRSFWRVLLADQVTDAETVRAIQTAIHSLAQDRARSEDSMVVRLKTPSRQRHNFRMNMVKLVNESNLTDRIILTFHDLEAEEN